jgi:membrane protease YdiL (CAAX protease family)
METPSKRLMQAQIFVIFVLPVILLYFKIVPVEWRMILLAFSSIFIYGIIRHEKWTHQDMGIHHDNFKKALPFYLFFTIVGVAFLFLIDHQVNMPDIDSRMFFLKTWLFFIPISFFQEFAFRSFLMPRLKKIYNNNLLIIIINSILFCIIHVIYPNLGIGLPLTFVSGIFFAWLYFKYPNLVLVSMAHSVLNLVAVLLGFFGTN